VLITAFYELMTGALARGNRGPVYPRYPLTSFGKQQNLAVAVDNEHSIDSKPEGIIERNLCCAYPGRHGRILASRKA
jgi:hypothetical protein